MTSPQEEISPSAVPPRPTKADEYSFDTAWGEAIVPRSPRDIALDESGRIYVADSINDAIYRFDQQGDLINTWETGPHTGGFSHPIGVAVHPNQDVYVLLSGGNRVLVFEPSGEQLTAWGEDTEEELGSLNALAIDLTGAVYVSSSNTAQVHKFDPDGNRLLTWEVDDASGEPASPIALETHENEVYALVQTGRGSDPDRYVHVQKFDQSGDLVDRGITGDPDEMRMEGPGDLAIEEDGSISVLETPNARVHRFDPSGSLSSSWGKRGTGPGQFIRPAAIAAGGQDSIIVADTRNQRIQYLSVRGEFREQFRVDGAMRFALIGDITYAHEGFLVAYDPVLDRVQAFDENGTHLRTWRLPRSPGSVAFEGAVTVDGNGTIYVADGDQAQIYRLTRDREAAKVWSPEINDPIGPSALATDAAGNVYVADQVGIRILKFSPAGELLVEWNQDDGLIDNPKDVVVSNGSVYVLDADSISEFDLEGHFLGTIITFEDSAEERVKSLDHIAIDQSGRVYAVDVQSRQTYILESGEVLRQWDFEQNHERGGPSAGSGIAVGSDHHVYIVNPSRPQILVFTPVE